MVWAVSAHAMTEFGLAVAGLGALLFVWGATVMVRANRSYHGPSEAQHRHEKVAHLIGGLLLAVGFGLQLGSLLTH
jgi:hypothetical protein